MLEGEGETLTQAFEAAAQQGKEIYLGSCHTLVVGGNALRRTVEILNYFNSRPQTRATMLVACTGGKASSLLKDSKAEPSPAAAVEQELLLAQKEKRLPPCRMMNILSALEDPTRQAVLPLLQWEEKDTASPPLLAGALLFGQGKVGLTMSCEEILPLNWLQKGRGNLLLQVKSQTPFAQEAALLMESFDPEIKVDLHKGVPQIELRLKVKGRVSEYGEVSPDRLQQRELEYLQQAAAQQMTDRLNGLMQSLCRAGCDPLRLGECLKRSHPQQWAEAQPNWPHLLEQAQWKAEVNCRLTTYSGK